MKRFVGVFLCSLILLMSVGCAGTGNAGGGKPQKNDIELGEITGEISVSAYSQAYRSFLEEAARLFEEKYPGTKINVEVFSAMPEIKTSSTDKGEIAMITMSEDSQAELDYINKINTELMSGKGADVLAMDVIPYYKYADSGMLEDLNKYMAADEDFNINDYRENLLKAAEYGSGLYIFPMDFMFDYLAYDSSILTEALEGNFTIDQLVGIGSEVFEKVNAGAAEPIRMFDFSASGFVDKIYKLNYNMFVDIKNKIANYKDGYFTSLLNNAADYAKKGYIRETDPQGMMTMESFEKMQSEQFFYKTKNSFNLLQEYNTNSGMMMAISFGGGSGGNSDNDKTAGFLTGDNGEIPYTYSQAYGISANSQNKTLAWEFIKFMSGEEVQSSANLMALPLNKAALETNIKRNIAGAIRKPAAMSTVGGTVSGGMKTQPAGEVNESTIKMQIGEIENVNVELTEEQLKIYGEYMEALNKLASQLNVLYIQDSTVDKAVSAELKNFFNNEKTADEIANVLQNRVQLYLSE